MNLAFWISTRRGSCGTFGILGWVFLFLSMLLVCPSASQDQPTEEPLATPANAPGPRGDMLVNTSWLVANLNSPGLIILQVGKDEDTYKEGHIPGAQFVGWNELTAEREGVPNELPPMEELVKLVRRLGITEQSRIVIYDDEEGLYAARAYVTLDYLGLGERASLLDGQWKRWQAEKRPISKDVRAVKPSEFTPRPRPDVIQPIDVVKDLSWESTELRNAPVVLVDARPAGQYSGQESGEGVKRPGHIPGAVNVFSMDNLVSEEDPTFLPMDQLRALYSKAGVKKGDLTVSYCRSGVQASLTYFTLKYLGYDVRLYDGSFYEWSSQPDTQVVNSSEGESTKRE